MTTLIPSLVPDYDCIVIGAGLSGLSAATTLLTKDPDLKVLVLEAQAEVGGRTKSDKSTFTVDGAPFAVDLGANWFHGLTGGEHSGVSPVAPGNPLKPIADEIDLPYTFTDWDNSFTYQGGEKQTQAELDASYKAYEEFAEEGSAFVKNLNADQSLAKTLESILNDDGWKPYKDAVNRFLYSEKIAGAAAAPALLSSNLLLDEAWLEGGDYLVRDFGAIAVHLADQLPDNIILKEQLVTAVDTTTATATVTTSTGSYTSKSVITTLPVGVLKRDPPPVAFTPALPAEVTAALETLTVGLYQKHFVQFPTVFWEEDKAVFFNYNEPSENSRYTEIINLDAVAPGSRMLLITETGAEAYSSEELSDESRLSAIMETVRRTWPDAPDPVEYKFTAWGKDEYAFGSYSAPGVGNTCEVVEGFAGDKGGLFFAGEHTYPLYSGTSHGAYLSGVDAARRVLGEHVGSYCGSASVGAVGARLLWASVFASVFLCW